MRAAMSAVLPSPFVTVVIPARAPAPYLDRAVDSALRQTARDLAVVVIDDGAPTDPPVATDAHDLRLILLRCGVNRGAGGARNQGWQLHHDARYVAFLDADDMWDTVKLDAQLEYLETHPDCVALGCRMRYISSDGTVVGIAGQAIAPADEARIARGELFPFQLSSMVVRREALVRIDGFDEALGRIGSEDLDLLARLSACGRIATLGATLGSYRIHPDSAMSRHRSRINRGARFVRRRQAARTAGGDLTWDAFAQSDAPSWSERRQDAVERCYRRAALWYAERNSLKAIGYGLLAAAIDPRYTLRRLLLQRAFQSRRAEEQAAA
jgi:GT2 family glycosyltransferase